MSYLALIVCIIFVLWLLRIERKQNPSASPAIWIPTIWMMLHASLPLGYWLGGGEESNVDRVVLLILLCLGVIILMKRRFDWYSAFKENSWLTLLICFMCVSILWSDTPGKSFKDWVREMLAVIMGFLIVSEVNPREALQCILRRFIYILIPLSLLLSVFFPEYGQNLYSSIEGEISWSGVSGGKNGLGRLCLISVFFLVWSMIRQRQAGDVSATRYHTFIELVVLGISLLLLKGPGAVGALSITSILTLVVGLATFFGLLWMKKFKRILGVNALRIIIATCIVVGTASFFVGGLIVGGSVTAAIGREDTLTGRNEIWARLIPDVMREPIVGHGLSFSGNPHNAYLAIILEYGFVGLLFFSMFLLSSCRKAHKELSHDYHWGSFWICFLVMTLLYSIAEGGTKSLQNNLMAILLFLSVTHDKAVSSWMLRKSEPFVVAENDRQTTG